MSENAQWVIAGLLFPGGVILISLFVAIGLREPRKPEQAEPAPQRERRSPYSIFYEGGGIPNGRTAEILRLADESHHRQQAMGLSCLDHDPKPRPDCIACAEASAYCPHGELLEHDGCPPAAPSDGPLAGADDDVLRMLAGANFGPNSGLILPSGQRLEADEAQALTSAYAPDADERNDR